MPDRETAHLIRGVVTRGTVSATNDNGASQTATITQWAGVEHKDVEVLQPFGIASRAPRNGLVILLSVGGDQGDLVALPVGSPEVRLGFLAEGEAAIYTTDGSRVHVKADGSIHVTSSKGVLIEHDGRQLEVAAGYVRGRMDDGARFVAGPGFAKLKAGGHFIAATTGGVIASTPVVIAAEPSPDV